MSDNYLQQLYFLNYYIIIKVIRKMQNCKVEVKFNWSRLKAWVGTHQKSKIPVTSHELQPVSPWGSPDVSGAIVSGECSLCTPGLRFIVSQGLLPMGTTSSGQSLETTSALLPSSIITRTMLTSWSWGQRTSRSGSSTLMRWSLRSLRRRVSRV